MAADDITDRGPAARAVPDRDARAAVAQGGGAVGLRADVVALHQVAGGGGALDRHARPGITGNDVPRVGIDAADLVAGTALDGHAGRVRQGDRPRKVRADAVLLHEVIGPGGRDLPAAGDLHAGPGIARDQVALVRHGAADEIVGRAVDAYAGPAIAQGSPARDSRADEVAFHQVVGAGDVASRGAGHVDSVAVVGPR